MSNELIMAYSESNIMRGEKPYEVLRYIGINGVSTTTDIVEHTGMRQPHVSEILKYFKGLNLVTSKKKGRSTPYKLNFEGFEEFLITFMKKESGENLKDIPNLDFEEITTIYGLEYTERKEFKAVMTNLYRIYCKAYFKQIENSNIRKMLIVDLLTSIDYYTTSKDSKNATISKMLSNLELIAEELNFYSPQNILDDALEEMAENK